MSEKKNIDRLFQEQFKDFETAPPEYVWENIHDALQQKKKRRVIPLWFRLGGVAAVLLVGLFISWPYLQGVDSGKNGVVIEHGAKPVLQPGSLPSDKIAPAGPGFEKGIVRPADSNGAIVDADKNNNTNAGKHSDHGNNATGATPGVKHNGFNNNDNAVAGASRKINAKAGSKNNSAKQNINDNPVSTTNDAVAGADALKANRHSGNIINKNKTKNNSGNISVDIYGKRNDAVAAGSGTVKNRQTDKSAVGSNSTVSGKANAILGVSQNQNTAVAQNSVSGKNGVQDNNTPAKNKISGGVNTNVPVIEKDTSVEQAVAVVDTVKPVKENELEKLLREKEEGKKEEQVAENNTPKWNIKPQVAPVFYNSLSQGSPIDGQFASNSKSFNNDLSMGVGVNYAVTSRLKLRSGINTVNLNYATQDVQFYASLGGSTNNILPQARNANIVVHDKIEGQASTPDAAFVSTADTYNGSMVQRTGYLEVPIEMSYAVINKKFGIELIGGVSTLFLNQNNVSVVSTQGLSTSVGEAANLNNIHFSTNVGVGFKYRFFRAFEASFEPTFKYQVNTFSRDAGNFKPYFIGLYSGISFSF